jgi:hypothetical protein
MAGDRLRQKVAGSLFSSNEPSGVRLFRNAVSSFRAEKQLHTQSSSRIYENRFSGNQRPAGTGRADI